MNQTRPHCVNQMGKTHFKPLAARHGRGTAWKPHGNGMLCVNRPEWGEGSASRPGRSLAPGKTRYSLYRRLGGPQGRSGQVRKISAPPGFDPRTVQPVASRYTDFATWSDDMECTYAFTLTALCTAFRAANGLPGSSFS